MACCFDCILQSGGGSGLSAQIGALQQSWRANAPADFARTELWEGAVAVRYAHLAATAINMRTGGGICAFVGLSECRGRALYVKVARGKKEWLPGEWGRFPLPVFWREPRCFAEEPETHTFPSK